MNNMSKVILVGGKSRCGKSTFAKLLVKQLEESGQTAKVYNFAYSIKRELHDYIWGEYGLDSFSEVTEHKNVFRNDLINFGKKKRAETEGRYFADKIQEEIIKDDPEFAVVADWRFGFFERDEHTLTDDFGGGIRCHITKWKIGSHGSRIPIIYDNPEEEFHDPIIKGKSDYFINWTEPVNSSLEDWCNIEVVKFMNHYGKFFSKGEIRA